ncbi:MAG: hypothetical protein IEMM0002_1359 [bacterium]|nr:MAG: hypothetical protein IEMM0002_1359 [bacterium]
MMNYRSALRQAQGDRRRAQGDRRRARGDNREARKISDNRQSGIALVITLWTMVILIVLASQLVVSTRSDLGAVVNGKEDRQAYFIAYAGIQMAVKEILGGADFHYYATEGQIRFAKTGDDETGAVFSSRRNIPVGEGVVSYSIGDLDSKLDLNRLAVDGKKLRFFLTVLFPEGFADALVDSIMDWVDKDDDHRANGAESDYYHSLDPPYGAKNGPFDAISELKLVKAVTSDIYEVIASVTTIFPVKKINANTAPELALRVSGLREEEIIKILNVRDVKGYYEKNGKSNLFEITSTGRFEGSPLVHSIKAVMKQSAPHRLVILDWADDYY